MMNKKVRIELTGINQRTLFKRETLVKKLNSVVEKIPLADLPATIKAIYAFGGILREKERLHDIDVFCLFSQNQEQSQRWQKFRESFNNLSHSGQKSPIRELWHLLEPYYDKEISLAHAVQSRKLYEALIARGIEPKWAGLDVEHIMRLGGWESLDMVLRYTKSVKFEESLKLYKEISLNR